MSRPFFQQLTPQSHALLACERAVLLSQKPWEKPDLTAALEADQKDGTFA